MTRDELVDRMIEEEAAGRNQSVILPQNRNAEYWHELRLGMSSALDVAVGELLADAATFEKDQMERKFKESVMTGPTTRGWEAYHYALADLIANRRARCLKPKTVEERVTIQDTQHEEGYPFHVNLDGIWVHSFGSEQHAEIYRLGLIQKLKEKSE